ncbi:hypothetical protein [Bradyrhizobium sp. C9]|uniref:hypothetical protein n=1 Tax=Bradyrhizobium sp. C9 TaxID=142585 RepID=UPI000BE8228E|nr:hypothetical protein [Bradyrhizobium sp. C9]PDT77673.1 hypothetical protein CO675_08820 [Bradyrhizobium sp. C9]
MSYDLMVFEPSVAPEERKSFLEWYGQQTKWSEGHSYNDPSVSTPSLQAYFQDIIKVFPAMNGPFRSDDFDDPKVTDHCVGRHVIYSAFTWSCAEQAYSVVRQLAAKHRIGFFDVSAENGDIILPAE